MQDSLLPSVQFHGEAQVLSLDILPSNDALFGDPPDAAMIASVRSLGVLQPIIVMQLINGHYEVAAGRGRIKAARAAGLAAIPARVYPDGWINPAVLTLVENEQRRNNPLADLAALERLLAGGADEATIYRATGMTAQLVRARLRLQQLVPELRTALEDGAIRITVAEQAARLPPDRQATLVARLAERGKVTKKDVMDASRAVAADAVAQLPAELFSEPSPTEGARGLLNQLRAIAGDDAESLGLLRLLEQRLCGEMVAEHNVA